MGETPEIILSVEGYRTGKICSECGQLVILFKDPKTGMFYEVCICCDFFTGIPEDQVCMGQIETSALEEFLDNRLGLFYRQDTWPEKIEFSPSIDHPLHFYSPN